MLDVREGSFDEPAMTAQPWVSMWVLHAPILLTPGHPGDRLAGRGRGVLLLLGGAAEAVGACWCESRWISSRLCPNRAMIADERVYSEL
jgi:hypothetical protein